MVDLPVKIIDGRKWIILNEIDDKFIFRAFDINKARYHKIIIMCDADSVTSDTPMLLFNEKNELFLKKYKPSFTSFISFFFPTRGTSFRNITFILV